MENVNNTNWQEQAIIGICKKLKPTENLSEGLIAKCYVVVESSMYEGYYFNYSKVFTNRMDAERYIEQLDVDGSFDIMELDLIN